MIETRLYDERGKLYKLVRGDDDTDPSNTPPAEAVVRTFNYDENGNFLEELDSIPQPSTTALSPPTTHFPGSATGDVVFQVTHDGFDRVILVVDGEGTSRSYDYDEVGNTLSSILRGRMLR